MNMTPQARRRIAVALATAGENQARERFNSWAKQFVVNQPSAPVPYDIAEIALNALKTEEKQIEGQLAGNPDDDTEADLLNDLAYVQAIKAALIAENVGQ